MTSKPTGKLKPPAAPMPANSGSRRARPDPAPPPCSREAGRLAAAILEVLAGVRTPTQAAQVLSLSIPRYYQLEQRALEGLVHACEPRPRGPGVDPQREVRRLEKQLARLQQECGRQQALVRAAQRTIGLAPPTPAKPAAKPGTTAGTKPGSSSAVPVEGGKRKRRPRRATVRALKAARACLAAATAENSSAGETSVAVTPVVTVEQSLAASPREETREPHLESSL